MTAGLERTALADLSSTFQAMTAFFQSIDLDGNFIDEVITGLGMPTSAAVQGDYVSVPDLHGRVVILDKNNVIMAVLGFNPDRS